MKLVEQIQDNAITKLTLTCEDEDVVDNIHEVIGVIKKNSSILTVHMVDDFLGCVRNDARTELISALGKVTCLQEVRLEEGLLQIVDIAELLLEVSGLKVLTMKNIVFQGTEEDFRAAELTLKQHPSIKEFSLDGCETAVEEISLETLDIAGREQACAHGGIRTSEPNPANARSA
jgi:hypothetical protein